ncbi:MAG: type I-U CRISPR-associated helicase/endonuclease Cas3 [Pseudomonadota bacterium]|nr:type I-U CRISPR-associated helicase/endonuclease Cas3 [Pseudomonadota bacterium]
MIELNAEAFSDFFREVWKKEPFTWQKALADRVLAEREQGREGRVGWPEAIALPTAAGKTACMDIAVFALAAQAGRLDGGQPLTAPRRIFLVVDRRIIVDEAFERACLLATHLAKATGGVVKIVADRLRQLADSGKPLEAHYLRGGALRSEAWVRSPVQPMIAAGTVDQIGSRLLFRGYGPGQGMRSVHAGLTGNDSLILLDEAHCAQPFLETLQAVGRYREWTQEEDMPLPPFKVTVMSATPPAVADVFRDESPEGDDPNHPLGRRQLAEKPASLRIADKAKGKDPGKIREELAKKLLKEAESLVTTRKHEGFAPAVVIFCNRVDTARKVHGSLTHKGADAHLLTGRMRPLDKEEIIDGPLAEMSVDKAEGRRLERARFVVATQTLEVGANLDFDLLVTECASLDALRQRFGRLNRLGRDISAQATIVVRADQAKDAEDDPVYGAALTNTWNWLEKEAGAGVVNFGIARLAPRLPVGEELARLNAPQQHAPVLLPAHVDALAQTAPEPWPSPDVALFLHGPRSSPADVQVCWRTDLGDDDETDLETLTICPPSSPECLSVPFGQMRRWLAGERGESGADVEGTTAEGETYEPAQSTTRRVIRWRGREKSSVLQDAAELRPGDLLVVPAKLGGWNTLATLGAHPLPDWGDRAHARMRGKAQLRLHPKVLRQWPEGTARDRLIELVEQDTARLEDDPESLAEELREALADWTDSLEDAGWSWLQAIAAHLAADKKLYRRTIPHPAGGLILSGGAFRNAGQERAPFSDEDDAASSGSFRSLLPVHLDGVAEYAGRHARLSDLPADLAAVVKAAGRCHDLGKAEPRFQAWLRGGNPWARGPLLAKSPDMAQSRAENRKARERAGYPKGGRHELLSVRLLESTPEDLPEDATLRDLLLHLVESHHGHCRPFAPVVEDPTPVQVSVEIGGKRYSASSATGLERFDAGPAERYWRLTRRYGWWGLAWLEALMRLADHRRSAWEGRQGDDL